VNNLIMSGEKTELVANISKFGYNIINSENLDELLPFEKTHTDIQCLKIRNHYFVLKNCQSLISTLKKLKLNVTETSSLATKNYPNNILLNCLYINNKLFCKKKAVDKTVLEFCKNESIEVINVNQGYTKCSTAVIDDSFITSDKGIYEKLTECGVEGILIKAGEIQLDGVDYGFIGGCCFCDDENAYFTGDVTKHSDYNKIKELCFSKNKNIVRLSKNKLYDIGGFVAI